MHTMNYPERRIPRKESMGCLGKMVNIFEFNNSPLLLTNTDSRPQNGTPIKALIAEELSKEEGPKQAKPNLVAQLMGLDTLPHQHPLPLPHPKRVRYPITRPGAMSEDHALIKDVYEIATENEKRLELVRQKFTEAKRLATDEKGCQSKEFIDAVEVLSSNREMFLKFLQESNSMFSSHLYDIKATPETKRITVLKPSDSDRVPSFNCSAPPTRIVVLKPTAGNVVSGEEENVPSSVFSNGYVGDDEVMSPSWDFVNKVESPCSNSSTSRVSYSPESSVCREAKKRLSERWAMMSAVPETCDSEKVSGTLGEMLSLSTVGGEERNELEVKSSLFCFSGNLEKVGDVPTSPKGFNRSRSVPSSSTVFETPKKLSLRGRVSEFFFRSKKSKDGKPESSNPKRVSDVITPINCKSECGETTNDDREPWVAVAENLKELSPASGVEPLLNELKTNPKSPHHGSEVSLKSNVIGKSPPIGSISRTLSWNDSFIETFSQTSKTSPASSREEEDQPDWIFLLETLLSEAGFLGSPSESSFLQKWHSPESPLDPDLREKYANLDNKELVQEARRRAMRSYRKLIFDSVNSGLAEFGGGERENVVEYLWGGMRKWFISELRWCCREGSGLVDSALRKAVVGNRWADDLRNEMRWFGIEIQICLLNQLVDEAILDLNS